MKESVKLIFFCCNFKGVLRILIDPKERQCVCTVDRKNPTVMIPINKTKPKLANFTETNRKIITIYKTNGDRIISDGAKNLSKTRYEEALAGERVFVVKFLQWRTEFPYPLGLAIDHIPHGTDFEKGMKILYEEHNIKRMFDAGLDKRIKKEFHKNWQIPTKEKARRVYFDNVFTIDPRESLDLDDAISIRSLDNGNYELHIHIADVSYFVQPDTDLDEEARLRGTSYYPPKPHKRIPMLPLELSENCCSFLEGKERLALTVSVEVTFDGTVVSDATFNRTVICSRSRLTYVEAQQIIDETSQNEVSGDENVRTLSC